MLASALSRSILFLLLLCANLCPQGLTAAVAAPVTPAVEATTISLDRKAVEARLGRKLNLAERMILGVAKRKARRQARKDERSGPMDALAVVSFGLGVASIAATFFSGTLFVLFGLGAIVTGIISLINLSGKSDYKRGRGFAIAGIATPLGWLLVLTLLVLLFFGVLID